MADDESEGSLRELAERTVVNEQIHVGAWMPPRKP